MPNMGETIALIKALGGSGGGGSDITDVQVNGTSVVSGGVANVPMSASNKLGVVKVGGYGLSIRGDGTIAISSATSEQVKSGTASSPPIVPDTQHQSTFYGLAKAAGADMASLTGETVGIYPAAQKSAIQAMLGILDMIAPAEGAQASKSYSDGQAFCHAGALYKATSAIASGDAIVPGTNCEQTTIIDLIGG